MLSRRLRRFHHGAKPRAKNTIKQLRKALQTYENLKKTGKTITYTYAKQFLNDADSSLAWLQERRDINGLLREAIEEILEAKSLSVEVTASEGELVSNLLNSPHETFAQLLFKDFKLQKNLIPLGVNANGEEISLDLTEAPHTLISGGTGSGKSVLLRNFLAAVMHNDWEAFVIDLTGFSNIWNKYSGANVAPVANSFEDVNHILEFMQEVIAGKLAGKYKSRILLIIEELGSLTSMESYDKDAQVYRDRVIKLLEKIARMGRHAGIHLVASTQNPNVTTIPEELAGYFGNRILCGTVTASTSLLALDTEEGVNISSEVSGRAHVNLNGDSGQHFQMLLTEQEDLEELSEGHLKRKGETFKNGEILAKGVDFDEFFVDEVCPDRKSETEEIVRMWAGNNLHDTARVNFNNGLIYSDYAIIHEEPISRKQNILLIDTFLEVSDATYSISDDGKILRNGHELSYDHLSFSNNVPPAIKTLERAIELDQSIKSIKKIVCIDGGAEVVKDENWYKAKVRIVPHKELYRVIDIWRKSFKIAAKRKLGIE